MYIPSNDSKMVNKCDIELKKNNDIRLLLPGYFNAWHPIWNKSCKAPNKNGKILEDIMSRHKVQIQNDQYSTYVNKRGCSTIDPLIT